MTYRSAKIWLASALLLPALSYASDLSYSYVEGTYGETEIDVGNGVGNVDGDGFAIAGSLAVAPNWHVFADFASSDFDFNVESETYRVGGGFNYPISDSADVIARLSYVSVDVQVDTPFGSFDADEDGFGVGAGVRGKVADSFELEGAVEYVDLGGDSGGDTSFIAEGRYFFTPMFALGAGFEVGDDFTTYVVNARLNFK